MNAELALQILKMFSELKREIISLRDETREELKKMREENEKRWEENKKMWDETKKLWTENRINWTEAKREHLELNTRLETIEKMGKKSVVAI